MVRDVRERLELFGVANLEIRKVGLTLAQVKKYKLPPNPAKSSDSRAGAYVAEHGNKSWEVEAIDLRILARIVDAEVETFIHKPTLSAVKELEELHKNVLRKALGGALKKLQA